MVVYGRAATICSGCAEAAAGTYYTGRLWRRACNPLIIKEKIVIKIVGSHVMNNSWANGDNSDHGQFALYLIGQDLDGNVYEAFRRSVWERGSLPIQWQKVPQKSVEL